METLAFDVDYSQLGKYLIVGIIVLVIIGFLLSLVITAIVGRVIIAVIVVGLAVFGWQNRQSIIDDVKNCKKDVSFFGLHVSVPDDVIARCKRS